MSKIRCFHRVLESDLHKFPDWKVHAWDQSPSVNEDIAFIERDHDETHDVQGPRGNPPCETCTRLIAYIDHLHAEIDNHADPFLGISRSGCKCRACCDARRIHEKRLEAGTAHEAGGDTA